MDDYKQVQIMISPDALAKIKQILMVKKMNDSIDTLDNQWAKIIDGIQDRKNSITIETKKDKDKEGK
jgi:hypothetical protein|tara:strand:+ start:741 stop:941 length:201 start_codon:yes stop_codon:yes gene_type:complete